MHRAATAIATFALLATACSSGGDQVNEPADQTTAPTTTAGTPPTTPPSATTETTTTPTPTDPPATAPSTSTTTTTTIPKEGALAQELFTLYVELTKTFLLAIENPSDPDLLELARDHRTASNIEFLDGRLAELIASSYVGRPNPDIPPSWEAISTEATVSDDGNTATIELCEVDSHAIVIPPEVTGGIEAVINDLVVAIRRQVEFEHDGTEWLVSSANTLDRFERATSCTNG